ncbi:MAG: UDP-N-acetyl-D-mannosamine dehydrogenase [Proteobacteria bacterium]|nr:UDP-N-acetyl-D-mannosamine dehydrogenase [Pseudomonadota bacterium]
MKTVSVIGMGYIGLPTATLLASKGYQVAGMDVNPKVVDIINQGKIHIVEPDLDVAVHKAVESGKLKAFTSPQKADIFILAVPTPFLADKKPDMTYVRKAAESICTVLEAGNLVILESTSPIGATRVDVAEIIYAKRPELVGKLHIAHCPERVLPGQILRELVENDRVVGGVDEASTKTAADFYRTFVKGEVLETTSDTAEMAKLTENAFRDVNIAFANELSLICDKLGINVWELIRLANRHPRVNILQPGPGVGGHCIAVDPWFIVAAAPEEAKLIRTAREVNDGKPHWVVDKVMEAASKSATKPVIGLLGMAYKPDVDDLRESPSVEIAHALKRATNAEIIVCEPYVDAMNGFKLATLDETLAQANILVMLTDHKPFKDITLGQLAGKQIIDTRGTFERVMG